VETGTEAHVRLLSPEFLRFRMVFLSANGEHLMTPRIAATCVLPTIDLRRDERLGSQIQVHCATYWSIRCEVIDILGSSDDVGLIVIRLPALGTKNASSPFHRRRIEDLEPSQISQQEFDLLLRLQMTGETGRGPFSRLTWLDDARSWLADVLHVAPNDLRLSQHHVGPCRALLNVATSSERQYWLKGVRGCESGLMHLLEQEATHYVPRFIAYHSQLSLYLTDHAGAPLSAKQAITDRDVWNVSRHFARLQRQTLGILPKLRELVPGLPSTGTVVRSLEEALPFANEGLAFSLIAASPVLSLPRLQELVFSLKQVFVRLAEIQPPEVLLHGDLHTGNILTQRRSVVFVDWEEARLGTLFENVEYLSLLKPNERSLEPVMSAYSSVWGARLSNGAIKEAIKLSRPLTIATRLLRLLQRRDEVSIHTSSLQGPSLRIMIRQLEHSLQAAIKDSASLGSALLVPEPITPVTRM